MTRRTVQSSRHRAAELTRQAARGALPLLVLGSLALGVTVLAGSLPYRHLAPDQAVIKVSVRHSGVLLGECRTLSAEQLARLPANMRAPVQCPRERSPLLLELDVGGERAIDATLEAQGLHSDGRAVMYRRLPVDAGPVRVDVRMKDDVRQDGFPYKASFETVLEPGRVLIVDFDSEAGTFVFL